MRGAVIDVGHEDREGAWSDLETHAQKVEGLVRDWGAQSERQEVQLQIKGHIEKQASLSEMEDHRENMWKNGERL